MTTASPLFPLSLPTRYTEDPPEVTLTSEQQDAGARAKAFLDEVLIPLEQSDAPIDVDPLPEDTDALLVKEARARGLWGVATPKEYGGQGLGELGYVVVREYLCQSIVGDVRNERGAAGDPWPVLFSASEGQKDKYLYPVLRGDAGMFFGLTEPSGGSDAAGILTKARRAKGGWVINGRKKWIGRGGQQPFGIVFAVTDEDKRARGGITAFFVEKGTPGFHHVRDLVTMGAARTAELAFEDCWVPDDNVLGEIGGAFAMAQRTLCQSRVRQAVYNLGAAQRAFDSLLSWLPERRTFGKALCERESVRWMLARAAVDLEAARAMIYRAAYLIDNGFDPRWEVPAMKTYAAQMACRVIDLAIQLHGARGISSELPLERLYRDIRGFRISEGADEVQRMLIAREMIHATTT
jgi:alkylation response protein AidB-like acyl-CoA dehydrogenase